MWSSSGERPGVARLLTLLPDVDVPHEASSRVVSDLVVVEGLVHAGDGGARRLDGTPRPGDLPATVDEPASFVAPRPPRVVGLGRHVLGAEAAQVLHEVGRAHGRWCRGQ